MVKLLRWFKSEYIFNKNITPDNIILTESGDLKLIDLGMDTNFSEPSEEYFKCSKEMCQRAFPFLRFGCYANHPYDSHKLKEMMRKKNETDMRGFEIFGKLIYVAIKLRLLFGLFTDLVR